MLTVLILTIGASLITMYHYWTSTRREPLRPMVWDEGHLVTLDTKNTAPLMIEAAWWYSQDITSALQSWCQDTSQVAFMATDTVLTDITGIQKPPPSADPYLTIIYQ